MDTFAGHAPAERPLEVTLVYSESACRLVLRGDLCGTAVTALDALVDQLGSMPCKDVVIDLGSLTNLDPVGANVIVGLFHYVVGRGGELRVTPTDGAIAAVLQSMGGAVIPVEAPIAACQGD